MRSTVVECIDRLPSHFFPLIVACKKRFMLVLGDGRGKGRQHLSRRSSYGNCMGATWVR